MQAQSKSILSWQIDVAQPTLDRLLFMRGPLNAQAQVPFASPVSYNTLVQPRGLAAADLNGDVEFVDAHHLRFRAVRRVGGNGRTYKITIIVMDGFGNVSTKDVLIRVPHDQRK